MRIMDSASPLGLIVFIVCMFFYYHPGDIYCFLNPLKYYTFIVYGSCLLYLFYGAGDWTQVSSMEDKGSTTEPHPGLF